MLKISIHNDVGLARLQIEGKIVGPWANELDRSWRALCASHTGNGLCLDIRGVTFADKKGMQVLKEIVGATDAEILADSPLTRDFANEARAGAALKPAKEN